MPYSKLNAGSGQRKFDTAHGWCNLDINPKWKPDIIGNWSDLADLFSDNCLEMVISYHSIEHAGCGEADNFIRESHRILKPGGSLIVVVPDPKAIARRYLLGQIDEYLYNVNTYGAWQGDPTDLHRWSYSREGLAAYLNGLASWHKVVTFDWRHIPGTDIQPDWWYHGQEAVK